MPIPGDDKLAGPVPIDPWELQYYPMCGQVGMETAGSIWKEPAKPKLACFWAVI